jgi:hypothetical protein
MTLQRAFLLILSLVGCKDRGSELATAAVDASAALAAPSLSVGEGERPMADKYKSRQVWSYKTRPGEEQSRMIVLQVDHDPKLGTIVHVSLVGLHIKSAASPNGETDQVGHMPVTEQALNGSVVAIVGTVPELPSYQEGYAMWKDAVEHGKGGVFTIPLAEAVAYFESALK